MTPCAAATEAMERKKLCGPCLAEEEAALKKVLCTPYCFADADAPAADKGVNDAEEEVGAGGKAGEKEKEAEVRFSVMSVLTSMVN